MPDRPILKNTHMGHIDVMRKEFPIRSPLHLTPSPFTASTLYGSTDPHASSLFRLPPELRLQVWEYTWPEPRVISHTMTAVRNEDGDDQGIVHHLFPAAPFSVFVETDYFRILNHTAIQPSYRGPVALWICQESRIHTLRRYVPIIHSTLPMGSFYMDPRRDSLLLCWDYVICRRVLERDYGNQLRVFEHALVDGNFQARGDADAFQAVLDAMGSVETHSLSEAFWEAWGRKLDRCGVRAATKFVGRLCERYHEFEGKLEGTWGQELTDEEDGVYEFLNEEAFEEDGGDNGDEEWFEEEEDKEKVDEEEDEEDEDEDEDEKDNCTNTGLQCNEDTLASYLTWAPTSNGMVAGVHLCDGKKHIGQG
ncbi:hypothetical protein BO70DRAFT_424420 [Aspergillus heteromorphus CBS 117.55]|uniref:2EXR domain-containing protein n=1 Tax=Aspergillus heteromorphus CBS 117.55 TaxID=1448321 RepID=A0A317WJ17_9EURO|nr:uncharacterized protein BO70DRAFT_424420 [Aspergillus heteromorphus CBS 117.55]PWY85058.1 hypothetical protein BO70DRAFT_424420 [Aspergillus heteromorphus CBS 117.55]